MDTRDPLNRANTADAPRNHWGDIDADTSALLVAVASDIALVLDRQGVIADVAMSSDALQREGCADWIGRRWIDTVAADSRQNVEEMLSKRAAPGGPRWRQVNHAVDGADLPIEYCSVHLGASGNVVAVGRDMRILSSLQRRHMDAQQTMEREYALLRHAETRYRHLFQITSEAALILDAASNRIIESNRAACKLLNLTARRLAGTNFQELFNPNDHSEAFAFLSAIQSKGRGEAIIRPVGTIMDLSATATLVRQHDAGYVLVRLTPSLPYASEVPKSHSTLFNVLEKLPDGFVVTDQKLRILAANTKFLELTEFTTEAGVCGERIDRWIGRHSSDMAAVLLALKSCRETENFLTMVRGEHGALTEVEITAVSVPADRQPCIGIAVRPVRRLPASYRRAPTSREQFARLVGHVHLSELVREATEMIERLCIEAALELTADNRVATAELLGLSRQTLYIKLHRYGIAGFDFNEEG